MRPWGQSLETDMRNMTSIAGGFVNFKTENFSESISSEYTETRDSR